MNEDYAMQERLKYIKQRLKEKAIILSDEIIETVIKLDEEYTDIIISYLDE